MNYINEIFQTDCIAGMGMFPDKSMDMILTDLPYGITQCRWDSLLPFDLLWKEFERVIKDNGAIVLTACQPFTTRLIHSNMKLFRYCWYWKKNQATGFPFAKVQPMRCVEEVCVFYKKKPVYNPQGIIILDEPLLCRGRSIPTHGDSVVRVSTLGKDTYTNITNYPKNLIEIKCERGLHPTQKPVELFAYLIRTYTNERDLVLDCCMGSGTTAIACIETGRNFTGFEIDEKHFQTATERIQSFHDNQS